MVFCKACFVIVCALSVHLLVTALPTTELESATSEHDVSTLKYLQFLHRHGDRTPVIIYPNDPYQKSYWPIGLGQLTDKGKRRAYDVGKYLRARYSGFLNSTFLDSQVNIRSTDVPRTLMTAESLLAGLYPPSRVQRWEPGMPWQPIPVHTVPQDEDRLLTTFVNCPNYNALYTEIMTSPIMVHLQNDFDELYEYLQQYVGYSYTGILRPIFASLLYDTLYVEENEGLRLPEWTSAVYPYPLKEFHDMSFVYPFYSTEMARYQSGYLLYNVVENTRNYISGDLEDVRVQEYSAHDTTIASFTSLLSINNYIAPPFATVVLMELHSHPEYEYVVKFFYYNDTTTDPYPLQLPNCDVNCPIADFYSLTESLVLSDPVKACYPADDEESYDVTAESEELLKWLSLSS